MTINVEVISNETKKDAILSKVLEYVMCGWPNQVSDILSKFKNKEHELSVEQGFIMWGHRVVIPSNLRQILLKELHDVHFGVVRMKAMARSYFWWPGLDVEIENVSKSCELYLKNASNPPRAELHVCPWPEGPNHRIHADFMGPIEGKMFMVIIDAFSKWIDIRHMSNITTESTIAYFRDYFASWGLSLKLVTDNGPAYTSSEFEQFMSENGIHHIRTAPYHPASNGAAKNAVKTFKNKYKLLLKENMSCQEAIAKYLFHYRTTVHTTTGCSPAELQIGRPLRSRLDLIRPTLRESIEKKQANQQNPFQGNRSVSFTPDEIVMAKD